MSIAFMIAAHTDPALVERTVQRLKPHPVFVHLDRKTELDQRWRAIDAVFTHERVDVRWAGYSQVAATLLLLRTALDQSDSETLVLISGACYPIESVSRLEQLFERTPGQSWMKYVAVEDSAHLRSLTDRYYAQDFALPSVLPSLVRQPLERLVRGVVKRSPLRKKCPSWIRAHGSSWWAMCRSDAQYVVDFLSDPANEAFRRYYRRSFASDEQVFHTILANAPGGDRAQRIGFEGRGTFRAANLHVIDPTLQRWYGAADFSEVVSAARYFVRKVRTGESDSLLDKLDEWAERHAR